MKKIYSTIIICAGFTIIGLSQVSYLTLSPSVIEITGDASGTKPADAVIKNTSEFPQQITWDRVTNDLPEGWSSAVCDLIVCYSPALSHAITPFTLTGGQEGTIHVNFYPEEITGYGFVEMNYYSISDSANYNVTGTFSADLTSTSFYSPAFENTLEIYPNPAHSAVHYLLSYNHQVSAIQLVNLVGKQVAWQPVNASSTKGSLNLTTIPDGIYFVRFMDASNTVLSTKKLSISK